MSSLSEESASHVRRVWTSFLRPATRPMTPKELAERVPTTEELLDACDPLLSSYAEKTWPKWSWWIPAEDNDPRFNKRRAWQKTLSSAFNYMTRPVQLVQFQHSVLREVAHLPTIEVSKFIADCLTRCRYFTSNGYLEFEEKRHPSLVKDSLQPWYLMPNARWRGTPIVFGHWASLSVPNRTILENQIFPINNDEKCRNRKNLLLDHFQLHQWFVLCI